MRIELRLSLNTLTTLLLINIVVFILGLIIQGISVTGFETFFLLGGLDTLQVINGSLWLTITSAFLHLDPIHFLVNMYSLYRIGSIIYNFYNGRILLLTYILGAIGGSLLTVLSTILFASTPFSLGASGAIFALIGLLLASTIKKQRYGMSLPYTISDILPVVVFSLWIGFIPGTRINNWAHIGGLISGIIIGLLVSHSLNNFKSRSEKLFEKILYIVSLILLILSCVALIGNIIYLIFFI